MVAPIQSEFPLRVAVCAWCKPKARAVDLGPYLGSISHGICLRHIRNLRVEFQIKKNASLPLPATPGHSRRRKKAFNHPELNYET